ncbi:MAG: GNAT family protein [Minisyncoccia bacterium]|jgi:RimJ/RimL family protein N-acetyltransferase
MKQPFLVGEHVYLRGIEASDVNEDYQSWFNDAEVCQYNSHHRFPNYRQDMEEYYKTVIKSKHHLILAIIDKSNDKHVGNISLQEIDPIDRSAEYAIVIGDKSVWGKGLGKEASRLILAHGFDALDLHRIYCGTSSENVGMQKLADNLGFKKEGVSREAMFKNGAFRDIIHYGMLKDDFKR